MYRWFGVVPHGLDVSFVFVLFGDFRSPFLAIFLEWFRRLSLWDLVVDVCLNPSWFFSIWFASQIREKRGSVLGFLGSRVRGILGRISLIPLDLASFGGRNLGYGVPMRCSYYPESLVQICGAIREIGSWIWMSCVTEPPKITPYYRLGLSMWPLSNNKELFYRFCRVKPGKSLTTGLRYALSLHEGGTRVQHYIT
jgi:hypothetical protein